MPAAARWRCGPPIINLTAQYNSQFLVSFHFCFDCRPSGAYKLVLMGANITMYLSKTNCLDLLWTAGLVKLTCMLEKHVMTCPPLPIHLVIQVWHKLLTSILGQKPRKKILHFFPSRGHKTNFKVFSGCLHWNIFFCSFAFVLAYTILVNGWRVKGTLSIKVLVLCPPELDFCVLRKTKKILKPKILYD